MSPVFLIPVSPRHTARDCSDAQQETAIRHLKERINRERSIRTHSWDYGWCKVVFCGTMSVKSTGIWGSSILNFWAGAGIKYYFLYLMNDQNLLGWCPAPLLLIIVSLKRPQERGTLFKKHLSITYSLILSVRKTGDSLVCPACNISHIMACYITAQARLLPLRTAENAKQTPHMDYQLRLA